MRWWLPWVCLFLGCDAAEEAGCVPGRQAACACPGGAEGVQICNESGTFDPCLCGDAGLADATVLDAGDAAFPLPEACARLIGPGDGIVLGATLPLTGPLGAYGPGMARGVELAVEAINAAGDGPLGVALCDSASDPTRAAAAVRALAERGVPAVIGPAASAVALHVVPEAARPTGTLIMSPSATAPALTALEDDDLFWRTAPSDALQATALGRHLRRLADADPTAHLPALLVYRQDPYGTDLMAAFRQAFCPPADCPEAELRMAGFFGDPAPAAAAIRGAGDAKPLIFFVFLDEFGALADALPGSPALYLTDALRDPAVAVSLSRAQRARVLGVLPALPAGPAYVAFADAHRTRFGHEPAPFAAHAWDATHALARALARAPEPSGADLAAALRAGAAADHPSAAGLRLFDAAGDAVGAVQTWRIGDDGSLSVGDVLLDLDGRLTPAIE